METLNLQEIQIATEKLHGLIAGISIDFRLNDEELAGLRKWLSVHKHLNSFRPFSEISAILKECLEDGVITPEEKEEILDWCHMFIEDQPMSDCLNHAIRRLYGVLKGIIIDDKITEEEVKGLQSWLTDYDIFKHHWPFSTTWSIVNGILEDKIVTRNESISLLKYCREFIKMVDDDNTVVEKKTFDVWMQHHSHMLKPIGEILDQDVEIEFDQRRFCFAGHSQTGSIKKMGLLVESIGGLHEIGVSFDLDYLVIGALSNPVWAYSTYGQKIVTVMAYRKQGAQTRIVSENAFMKQVKKKCLKSGTT